MSQNAARFLRMRHEISFFFDPSYSGDELLSISVVKDEKKLKKCAETCTVVLTWKGVKQIAKAVEVLCRLNIPYLLFYEAAAETIEQEADEYNIQNKRESFAYNPERKQFFAMDRVSQAGSVNHYFWQDLWCAQHVFDARPDLHYDIGSRVDGFISNLLTFGQKVTLIDVRPLDAVIPGVSFTQSDATMLESVENDSIHSLSALCSLEHFGLGRYGDTIDPEACFKCFDSIQKKVGAGGSIYIAVPVGKEGVEFNAHRIFSPRTIFKEFDRCDLKEYSIDYGTHIEYDADPDVLNDSVKYEFGLFWFVKK